MNSEISLTQRAQQNLPVGHFQEHRPWCQSGCKKRHGVHVLFLGQSSEGHWAYLPPLGPPVAAESSTRCRAHLAHEQQSLLWLPGEMGLGLLPRAHFHGLEDRKTREVIHSLLSSYPSLVFVNPKLFMHSLMLLEEQLFKKCNFSIAAGQKHLKMEKQNEIPSVPLHYELLKKKVFIFSHALLCRTTADRAGALPSACLLSIGPQVPAHLQSHSVAVLTFVIWSAHLLFNTVDSYKVVLRCHLSSVFLFSRNFL